jgi:hypothetical protein
MLSGSLHSEASIAHGVGGVCEAKYGHAKLVFGRSTHCKLLGGHWMSCGTYSVAQSRSNAVERAPISVSQDLGQLRCFSLEQPQKGRLLFYQPLTSQATCDRRTARVRCPLALSVS